MQALCHDFNIELKDHRFEAGLLRDGVYKRPGEWRFSQQADAAFEKFKHEFEQRSKGDKQRFEDYKRHLDGFDWWTWLDEIGFTEDDLLLRDLQDSTDFGESI